MDEETDKSLLSGLEKIDQSRDVQVRETTTLEKLLEISYEIVNKYFQEVDNTYTYDFNKMDLLYMKIYLDLLHRTRTIEINEQDIASFVLAKANHELAENEARVLGIYSSCLAQLLTERNASQGKRTTIHLDGNGSTFNYLFYFARVLDTVIIENFKGDNILAYAGSFGGRVDTLFCRGIKGKKLLNKCGTYHGRVNRAIAIDVTESKETFSNCGDNGGQVLQAIGINIECNYTLSNCPDENGYVDQMIGVGLNGKEIFSDVCPSNGSKVHQILVVDINGNNPLKGLNTRGDIDQIIYDNVPIYPLMPCRERIDGKKVRETYNNDEAENIERVIGLARSLNSKKGKPCQEILMIADELYALRYTCGRCFRDGVEK